MKRNKGPTAVRDTARGPLFNVNDRCPKICPAAGMGWTAVKNHRVAKK